VFMKRGSDEGFAGEVSRSGEKSKSNTQKKAHAFTHQQYHGGITEHVKSPFGFRIDPALNYRNMAWNECSCDDDPVDPYAAALRSEAPHSSEIVVL